MSTKYIASNWRLPNKAGVDSYLNDNYGLTFDGNEYISCDNISELNNLTEASWCGWFNRGGSDTYCLMSVFGFSNSDRQLLIVQSPTTLTVSMGLGGAGNLRTMFENTSLTFTLDEWYHLAFVYNESESSNADKLKVYINNVLQTNENAGNAINQTNAVTGPFVIGARAAYFNQKFVGSISEVAAFNYALSSTQISTLYGSSSLGAGNPMALKPAPVAYYPLGDNSASNPLTQPNEAVEDASVFDFDGSDDRVSIPELTFSGEFTLSMWVNPEAITGSNTFILGRWDNNFDNDINVSLSNNTPVITFRIGGTSISFFGFTTSSTIPLNEWSNLLIIRNSSNDINCYLNGVQFSTTTGSSTNTLTLDSIGRVINNSYGWEGQLSNIVMFNSDQTTEISNIYNSGVPATTYTNTPTAWYKLDQSANWDVSGSGYWDIPDASGNGNDGISSGMTSANLVLSDLTRNLPYDSYSFNFDSASSDKITGSGALISGNESRSFSLWYNITSALKMIPFSLGNPDSTIGGTNTQFAYCINRSNNATKAAIFGRGNDTSTFTVPATNDGNWHHLVVTYNQSALNVYLDGNLIATPSLPSSNYATNDGFSIGNWSVGDRGFNGKLSNISVFNEALTSTEVMKLYSNGMPQNLANFTPQPIAWYPLGSNSFWNGSQWTVRDMSTGGSNDGTGQNIGIDSLVGDSPRSEANGTGTNMDIPTNLEGSTKYSSNNSYSINMSSEARVQDTP